MNIASINRRRCAGISLVETMVGIGILGLLGTVFFNVLQSGLVLSAKNTAVNAAHEEARQGVLRMTRDIHASVSVPQLRDASYNVVDSTLPTTASASATPPTAAGVSFQNISSGPNWIWNDPGGSNGLVMIKDGVTKPVPGMRMIIPAWGIEDDIVKVTGATTQGHSNVFTSQSLETGVKRSPQMGGTTYAITYYTDRLMYIVEGGQYVADSKGDHKLVSGQYVQVAAGTGQFRYEGGELRCYNQRSTSGNSSVAGTLTWQLVAVVARNISSPKPFSVPLNRYGGPDNKYVRVQLSARDPQSTNRGYIATASLLETDIDYRSRITTFQ